MGIPCRVVRLRRVDCRGPGFARRRLGRGFGYFDGNGRRLTEPDILARISALVIPPAWKDGWICPLSNGHIQATGLDARGRRQYLYHDAWRLQQDRAKFDHMIEFALVLPDLRLALASQLAQEGLGRDRVLAAAVRLLDLGFFRIGTAGYAEENQTYGLATILKRHGRLRDGTISFDCQAKGGKRQIQSLVDPHLYRVIAELKGRRGGGPELLAYRAPAAGRTTRWVDVRSEEINTFLRDTTGIDCSAKDFRTWNATVLAAVGLAVGVNATSPTARQRCVSRAIAEVAHYLGNTPGVCRKSYVDPRVIDCYLGGDTIAARLEDLGAGAAYGNLSTQGAIEGAVIDLLAPEAGSAAA
jgi:DNA topoisomerase I